MTSKELNKKVMKEVEKLDLDKLTPHLSLLAMGQYDEVMNKTGRSNLYYQWLYCLVKLLKPKQVVELGAAAGISTTLMAIANQGSDIISVDCDPTAWKWMKYEYANVTRIWGDDLKSDCIPKYINLYSTKLWFIDTLHTETQLNKEIDLYCKYWKKGTVIVLDDININDGMRRVWDELPYDKCETPLLHYTGFGLFIV